MNGDLFQSRIGVLLLTMVGVYLIYRPSYSGASEGLYLAL